MNPVRFEGATIVGKPKNWDDKRDGICVGLPAIVNTMANGMKQFTSVWKPTPEERAAIANGANIALSSFGIQAPISITTAEIDGPIVRFESEATSRRS